MVRNTIAFLLVLSLAGVGAAQTAGRQRATRPPAPQPPPPPPPAAARFGDPIPNLNTKQAEAFAASILEFSSVEDIADGLGPVFNGRSCGECHSVPALGGGNERLVTRIGTRVGGVFDSLTRLGGSLLEDHAIGPADGSTHTFVAESVPAAATIVAHRRSTPLFGLGFIDATSDSTFIALAAQEAARNDGTAGRVSMVQNISAGMNTVGKFGWKAQVPTIFQFAGDAYLNELGVTSPQFPNENCPNGDCTELAFNPAPGLNDVGDGIVALSNFMTMLGAPPRGNITRDTNDGENVFERIGCNSCHVATLQTGASVFAGLDRKSYHPYSDFLLHDMGSLGDGIEQGAAQGRELRTAPLWGLRMLTTYLHDGRTRTIEGAILAHDGQGRQARDRFNTLDADSKAKLMLFLRSL
jgi:CxxC motif-containing protein (DUF1111 family)